MDIILIISNIKINASQGVIHALPNIELSLSD